MYAKPGGPFSYSPRGAFPTEDFLQHRRGLQGHHEDETKISQFQRKGFQGHQHDETRSSHLQRNSSSRPSGKSIYMQRKEYSETLNKQSDNFHFRVEHLFTCELDGQEVKNINDCVAKLKRLDTKGSLWPQDMIMELQGGDLLLSDIETKLELESLPLGCILETKAVLDSCAYNSLLTITVQGRNRGLPQVYMFQCEEVGAEHISGDLDKIMQNRGSITEPPREPYDIRSNLENIISQHVPGGVRQPGPRAVLPESTPPPPEYPPPQWTRRSSDNMFPPPVYNQDEMLYNPEMNVPHNQQELPQQPKYTETDRNIDILNHVLNDVEVFVGKVSAAADEPAPKEGKSKKKKKKNSKKNAAPDQVNLPSWEEYVSCLQKFKYGLNLLGKLNGELSSPSAPEYVHFLFSYLQVIVPKYPPDLPPSVLTPLLTEAALVMLSQEVSPEEDQLWTSLGDTWNIPRSRWPDGDMIPPYIPEFYDGWQLPPPVPAPPPSQNGPLSRGNSQRFSSAPQNGRMGDSQGYPLRDIPQQPPEEPRVTSPWGPPPPTRRSEPPLYMRVIYDFMARNNQELSIMKGDVVQVVDKSGQWWLVRNAREEEGHVPQNVLEPMDGGEPIENSRESRGPPHLDAMSTPANVKAWLEYKGFSKITVRSLGVLNGQLLLGMSRNDMKTVCPEEGAKVFFQLQAVKSAIALASESAYSPYNGQY